MLPGDSAGQHRRRSALARLGLGLGLLAVVVVVAAVGLLSRTAAGRSAGQGSPTGSPADMTGSSSSRPGDVSASASGSTTAAIPTRTLQVPVPPSASPARPADPVSVAVRRVGISSRLERLGLLPDGTLKSPTEFPVAGWYARGVVPGAVGPAVIAGHVDSVEGPAVFYRLRDVRLGDDVSVTDASGGTRQFKVTSIAHYAKTKFPTDLVYGPTALPVLRLVTCTGDFDFVHRSYLDNLVVSATLVAPRAA
ncbi:MAG: sortase [bacterium]